jgi:hypothetical protein
MVDLSAGFEKLKMHNFGKNDFFIRTEIDNPSSNFTGNAMPRVAVEWYQETCTCMSYGFVNAQISLVKKRLIGAAQTFVIYPRKPSAYNINRKMKGTSRPM